MQSARMLHDDHMAIETLMKRLQVFARDQGAVWPGKANRDDVMSELSEIVSGIKTLLGNHLAFEEERLFPKLAANGETDIGDLLTAEHGPIREAANAISEIARAARDEGFTPESRHQFNRLAFELADRVISHAEKEEMALLPMVEELLSADDDMELASAYMAAR